MAQQSGIMSAILTLVHYQGSIWTVSKDNSITWVHQIEYVEETSGSRGASELSTLGQEGKLTTAEREENK